MRVVPAILPVRRAVSEYSFVAYPAPVVAAPALVAAFRSMPLVAWSSGDLTIVGVGIAAQVRGQGSSRWLDVIAQARSLTDHADIVDMAGVGEHLARPRLLGGFAFAPNAASDAPWSSFGDAWFMLPRWTYIHDGKQAALLFARRGTERVPGNELADLRVALAMPFTSRPQPPLTAIDHGDRDAWRDQVRAITTAIASGDYTKIVAARSAVVSLAGEARAADMLAELDERHPETVRLLVRPSPDGPTFIAATPERLVRLDGTTASIDALAGSHAIGTNSAAALLGSGKDRREHAIVVDAIVSALQGLGADVRFPDNPAIRTLRHVLHLHTPITANLGIDSRDKRHVLELAEALHPTPAVGGTPTRAAMQWIAEREQTPRGWYSSPVGVEPADG
jgi:menaquinone-specific isochorismate synthase